MTGMTIFRFPTEVWKMMNFSKYWKPYYDALMTSDKFRINNK